MEDLLNAVELDPVVSTIGVVVVLLGLRMVFAAAKTAIKLVFLAVILIGAYLFLYGGQVS
ncbi:hypothetical protein [Euzebya sp.]|uniref:hypothetical protein n=1 Tax=Euzebya sp. TaxID=1971409 RepID=UPI0035117445